MTTHIYHLDTHEHGLFPGCPRCEEHAEHPESSLDAENIGRIRSGRIFTELDEKAATNLEAANQQALANADSRFNGGAV